MATVVNTGLGCRPFVPLPGRICIQKIQSYQIVMGMDQQQQTFRRIVTGHNKQGKAIIISDAPPVLTQLIGGPGGPTFFEVWHTAETPAAINLQPGVAEENSLVLSPPKNGTRLRVIEFPPEGDAIRNLTGAEAAAKFKQMGDEQASTSAAGAAHPLMHRTATVDYGIVLAGEITLILDQEETTIRTGDIVIQSGTNHAWANRSSQTCRMAFMLIDGEFSADFHTKRM